MTQNQIITYDINDLKPSFSNPDDMPIYISPFELKKPRKNASTKTAEEKAQDYRDATKRYYYKNIEKEKERKLKYYYKNKELKQQQN